MLNVLIVEDDNNIRNLMKIHLEKVGYKVYCAVDGLVGLDIFKSINIDIIITDIMMPNLNGIDFIKKIRAIDMQIPAIMVSAKGDLYDKKEGFLVGIDDYMVKPIEFDELILRMQVLLRRAKIASERKLKIKNVVLDYDTLTIENIKTKENIKLSKREFCIIFKLLSYPERAFTKNQIYDEFWNMDSTSNAEEVVRVYITKIRKKIINFPEIEIQTLHGIGYKGVRNE